LLAREKLRSIPNKEIEIAGNHEEKKKMKKSSPFE
jgi:hypothetical protein